MSQGLFSSPEKYLATLLNCSGTRILDCGVETQGTAELGVIMADAAMGGRGTDLISAEELSFLSNIWPECPWPVVQVCSDDPVSACLASQYAGWQINHKNFKAMASGPIRAAIAKEPIFKKLVVENNHMKQSVYLKPTNSLQNLSAMNWPLWPASPHAI